MNDKQVKHLSKYVCIDWLVGIPDAFDLLLDIIPQLSEEYVLGKLRPHPDLILRAFQLTPLSAVSVVLLSREPYKDGLCNGLAYDCVRGLKVPPSLANILQKIQNEYSEENTYKGVSYLDHLPEQGVLLLNKTLTGSVGESTLNHKTLWEPFFQALLEGLNKVDNIVWALMGESVHNVSVSNPTHIKLELPNPSPLAGDKFLNAEEIFKLVNRHLSNLGRKEIQW